MLRHPFTALLAGPTGCGKTELVKKIIEARIIQPFPEKVIWCYGAYQTLFEKIPNVTFHEGVPSDLNNISNSLIILDDLMSELGSNSKLTHLYTKHSHHRKVSVIFIVQNVFHKGKEMREVSLNSHYLIIFKNPRDQSQMTHLGRQLYPTKLKFFQEVYQDATSKPFGYLLVDLKPDTEDKLRLRTGILPTDKMIVYQPR